MKRRLAVLLATLALLPAALLAQDPKAAAQAAPPRPFDPRQFANPLIHVMRADQQKDGSYGGSARTTGLALVGFAKSSRQYREADGPFISDAVQYLLKSQQKDGSIAAANDKDPVASTLAAALAFDALDAKKYAETVKQAVAFAAQKTNKTAPAAPPGGRSSRSSRRPPRRPPSFADGRGRGEGALPSRPRRERWVWRFREEREPARPDPKTGRPDPRPSQTQEAPLKPLPNYDPTAKTDIDAVMRKGIEFLMKRQGPGGEYGSPVTKDQWLGVTALTAQALWAWPGAMPKDLLAAAKKATDKVAGAARADGSIHGSGLENYTTSASVGALVASKDPNYRAVIEKARKFLEGIQADEAEGISKDHWSYGGFGYGDEERPDMSNTHIRPRCAGGRGRETQRSGAPEGARVPDPMPKQQREQSHRSLARRSAGGRGERRRRHLLPGNSKAGNEKTADGKEIARSYGSMSYALLKGFVFAGLAKDDPRLKAVMDWCKKNYTLDRVPGYEEMAKVSPRVPYQGLYYYYMTMANALAALGVDTIETPDGKKHDWRAELAARLASLQKPDGSWSNDNSPRWYEGDELIATDYAILTLKALHR